MPPSVRANCHSPACPSVTDTMARTTAMTTRRRAGRWGPAPTEARHHTPIRWPRRRRPGPPSRSARRPASTIAMAPRPAAATAMATPRTTDAPGSGRSSAGGVAARRSGPTAGAPGGVAGRTGSAAGDRRGRVAEVGSPGSWVIVHAVIVARRGGRPWSALDFGHVSHPSLGLPPPVRPPGCPMPPPDAGQRAATRGARAAKRRGRRCDDRASLRRDRAAPPAPRHQSC